MDGNYMNQNMNQNQNPDQNNHNNNMNSYTAGHQDGFSTGGMGQNMNGMPPVDGMPPMNGEPPVDGAQPKQPKFKKNLRWLGAAVFAVLVAALAVGGGYLGSTLAYQQVDRVVVQRVETTADGSTSAAAEDGALTSAEIAAKTEPSVVAITTERMTTSNFWFGTQVESGAGSGVIISEDGYILTCDHVIEGADTIKVQLSDGTIYDGTLVGAYPENDIAVVKIEATGLTPAEIADSSQVVQGEQVYAVGNPEGRFSGSITDGLISAVSRDISMQLTVYNDDDTDSNANNGGNSYNDYWSSIFGGGSYDSGASIIQTVINVFQTSAPVSPGNSGGGLFNARGELIGIVNAKSSDSDAEGLGFAIPSNKAMEIANSLITTGSYTAPEGSQSQQSQGGVTQTENRAILGITAMTLTAQQAAQYGYTSAGVYIVEVTEQSTADAGLASGDRIISIDDTIVNELDDVTEYLSGKQPSDVVKVTVERGGKMTSADVTLIENPNAAADDSAE